MSEWTWSYFLGALSGLGFILLGAYTAFDSKRERRYTLPLFFGALGAQFAFTNLAASSSGEAPAALLFTIGAILVPLPGLLLLYYAMEQTVGTNRWLYLSAKTGLFLAAASAVIAGAIALFNPSLIQSAVGTSINPGRFYGFLTAPKFLGVAAALVILSATTKSPKHWLMVVGLAGMWAYMAGFNFGGELYEPLEAEFKEGAGPRLDFLLIFGAVTFLSGVVAPVQLAIASKRMGQSPLAMLLPILAFALGLVAVLWGARHGDDNLLAHPGATRLAIAGLLFWALRYTDVRREIASSPSSVRVPVVATTLALTIAIAANMISRLPIDGDGFDAFPWLTYGSAMAFGGLSSIGIFSLAAVTRRVRAPLHSNAI